MPPSSTLSPILMHMRTEPSRTWSLIVTLFGDMVVPRGGRLWLGTLLEILGALGIGGNVVRTAMSRLAADGWLERNRVGRNSFYRLADKGRATFAEAARRIYETRPPRWDGAFDIVVLGPADRDGTATAWEQAGYALLSPGVLVAVGGGSPARPKGDAVILRATAAAPDARRLASQIWPTDRLGDGYRRFLAAFRPLEDDIAQGAPVADLDALLARLLLIHAWRRLVLRDPLLPEALQPADWPGHPARALCAHLYRFLLPASERWLDEHALNEDGRLPSSSREVMARFRQ